MNTAASPPSTGEGNFEFGPRFLGEMDQFTSRGPSNLNYHMTLDFSPAEKSVLHQFYLSSYYLTRMIILLFLTLHLLIDTNFSQQG